jgi:hypothetical protein
MLGASSTLAAGGLARTGASSLPILFAGLALLGLGAVSLFAGVRRHRRVQAGNSGS